MLKSTDSNCCFDNLLIIFWFVCFFFCFGSSLDVINTFVAFMEVRPDWLKKHQALCLVARIIQLAIDGASVLYTVKGKNLFHFFDKIFKDIW